MLSNRQRSDGTLEAVLHIAQDLTQVLEPAQRYRRLLEAAGNIIPFDAACLLLLEEETLVVLAAMGLREEILERRFECRGHARFGLIMRSRLPVRFPPDTPIGHPFAELLEGADEGGPPLLTSACCPVVDGDNVVGVLEFDAIDAGAFSDLDDGLLSVLGALAGAAIRTESLVEVREERADRRAAVMHELQRNVDESTGAMMIGTSAEMRRLSEDAGIVAPSALPVLITGETGVGKELVARRVHSCSHRHDAPLIQINCAALPASIAASELFGHVRGAFTGAHSDRLGKFEISDGGTLLLDEIGELPVELQANLLRTLQNGEIQRVGSDETIHVDVRVIAVTNRNLETEVRDGRFRADLYHRLAAFPIHVAPLRERRDDIPLLAAHFVARVRRRLGLGPVRLSEGAKECLQREAWPGNIRELENVISRGVLRASKNASHSEFILVDVAHLDLEPAEKAAPIVRTSTDLLATIPVSLSFSERCNTCKREQIRYSLEQNDGKWAAAARDLGMHRSNLHRLAVRLGMRENED